jgi:RNA polymerase sigma factor (TIGR02999 family)
MPREEQPGDDDAGTDGTAPDGTAAPLDRPALDALFTATYDELRRLAAVVRRGDPAVTLNPTALVNEAWIRLSAAPGLNIASPLHFKRIAARAMRQILVEAARRRHAAKRGGPDVVRVTLGDTDPGAPATSDDILRLDDALGGLARLAPRQAAMVELRWFGGLDVAETAALLEISEATILRDWRAAKAFLARELGRDR